MISSKSYTALRHIRKKYVRVKLIQHAFQALAVVLVGTALVYKWGAEVPVLAFVGIATILSAVIFYALLGIRISKTSLYQVARHLNRNYMQVEDSTELLLKPAEALNFLERLQQQKVAERVLEIVDQDQEVFKTKPLFAYLSLVLAFFFSLGILYLPASPLSALAGSGQLQVTFPGIPQTASDTVVTIQQIEIRITPPAYTGKQPYKANTPHLRVEQGAQVAWQVNTSQSTGDMALILNEATALKAPYENTVHLFSRIFTDPALYYFNLNGQKSAYYTIEIIPDEPPLIQISKPAQYTEILFGEPQRVTLQAQLSDDYGIRDVNMIATVAKGTGEAVKFREEKISLDYSGNKRNFNIHKTLDLQKMGMTYGDELYFYIQAWDNHKGYTRSETYFVQMEDTIIIESMDDFAGGVNPVPEYFRSQRQIIIDTEKLVKDQKTLSRAVFEERSNTIGVDQKLLRLRYGKFLGEEFESGIGPGGGIPEGEEGHFEGDGHDHGEHDHEESENKTKAEKLLDAYTHKHDQEEEATLFEPAVKAKLKGALAQMWEAELRLRTHKPKEALPFEYKALRMLKEVQQSTRAYAAKTGFEPPPLKEPEKRLTGDLSKISAPSDKREIHTEEMPPHTKAALQWLERHRQGKPSTPADIALLERAGLEMAQEAVIKPGKYLLAMQDLRTIIKDLRQGRLLCYNCLKTAERTWNEMLPPVTPSVHKKNINRSSLSQQYLKELQKK